MHLFSEPLTARSEGVSLPGADRGLAWGPHSDVVAVGCHDGVALVDAQGTKRATLSCPGAGAVAYSCDGGFIAAAGWDGVVRVFDTATSQLVWQTAPTSSAAVSVAISDDQRWVAALSRDQRLGVYDLAHGTSRYPTVLCNTPITAGHLSFSPTLRHLLVLIAARAVGKIDYNIKVHLLALLHPDKLDDRGSPHDRPADAQGYPDGIQRKAIRATRIDRTTQRVARGPRTPLSGSLFVPERHLRLSATV